MNAVILVFLCIWWTMLVTLLLPELIHYGMKGVQVKLAHLNLMNRLHGGWTIADARHALLEGYSARLFLLAITLISISLENHWRRKIQIERCT